MRLGRCDGVQERLRFCIVGESIMVRGEIGLLQSPLVSIITISLLSERIGDEKPTPPLKLDSSSSDLLRLRSIAADSSRIHS